MKPLVPDLAMVPRLFLRSALVIPIPESSRIRALLALSGIIRISRSLSESSTDGSVSDKYLE